MSPAFRVYGYAAAALAAAALAGCASTSGIAPQATMRDAPSLGLSQQSATAFAPAPQSQEKTIKIGLIYDFSGPFSAAGSLFNYRGAKLAIDWANDKGGVLGKYKIVRVDADAQSILPLPASSPFAAR